MNDRLVVLFGTAMRVDDPTEKLTALKAFTDHVVPGRWAEVRPPNPQELARTPGDRRSLDQGVHWPPD
jgi:nitroimidazol reductase NimA-like FMN-containing flavoprotein (pyridoxamine 5'-phosphate oxidase superfamily)